MSQTQNLLEAALEKHQNGQIDEAREIYARIITTDENSEALHWFGILELQSGDPLKALPLLRRASELDPKNAQLLANLGNACFATQQFDLAANAYRTSLAINPDSAETQANLGNLLLAANDTEQAIFHYEKALLQNQKLPEIWRSLAQALLSRGREERALSAIERAVYEQSAAGHPPSLPLVMTRGNVMVAAGLLDNAQSCFELVVDKAPSFPQGYLSLANTLRLKGDYTTAIAHCTTAIELASDNSAGYYALGLTQMDKGALANAAHAFEQALKLDPLNGRAHRLLASFNRHTSEHPNIASMRETLTNEALVDEQRTHVHFGLGKALEDAQLYNEAFNQIQSANQLHRKSTTYHIEEDEALFTRTKNVFSAEFIKRCTPTPPGSPQTKAPQPIFIIGMPRSGTSLLEQILASHPDVHGAGELDWLQRCIKGSVAKSDGDFFGSIETLNRLADGNSETMQRLGADYLARINAVAPQKSFVVDKMPANFLYVAAIKCAMPNATIIHARRNPMATCWSIYKSYLGSQGHAYAFNQSELGRYYRLYQELMDHWAGLYGNDFQEVHYEHLVSNQETASRALIDACGLEWNAACLQFQNTERPVQTLSAAQIRRPMYSDALNQWQHQSGNLKPLAAALGAR